MIAEPVDMVYSLSGFMDRGDVIIHHHEYNCFYQYECGRTFLEICLDMGLDKDNNTNISL